MILSEAIKHCEEMADYQEHDAETWEMVSKHWGDDKQSALDNADECKKCAEEHRQLAEWLKELIRARILLEATHNLLAKQMESGYVLNLLSETVFYDEAECDGYCLMEDIENLLEYHV